MSKKPLVALLALVAAAVAAYCLVGHLRGRVASQERVSTVRLGKATPERRAEFLKAVGDAIKGFDDLVDNPKFSVGVIDDGGRDTVAVRCEGANPLELGSAVSIVVTNIALKYPGVRFAEMGEGAWKVILPDDTEIPRTGDFGLKIQ